MDGHRIMSKGLTSEEQGGSSFFWWQKPPASIPEEKGLSSRPRPMASKGWAPTGPLKKGSTGKRGLVPSKQPKC